MFRRRTNWKDESFYSIKKPKNGWKLWKIEFKEKINIPTQIKAKTFAENDAFKE